MIDAKKYKNLSQEQIDEEFVNACKVGDFDVIKYLLSSPDLKENADIHVRGDLGFRWTCVAGHLDVLNYLLTSPDLKDRVDIHADNDLGFRWACAAGHLDIIKYLLTSPDLKDHADIHANNDDGFQQACKQWHLKIINFFIFDMNIEKTKSIGKFLDSEDGKYENIVNWFNIRDLNNKLEKELNTDKIINEPKKIKL